VNVHDFEDKKLGKVTPYGAFMTHRLSSGWGPGAAFRNGKMKAGSGFA
jgi:hypothetical protein